MNTVFFRHSKLVISLFVLLHTYSLLQANEQLTNLQPQFSYSYKNEVAYNNVPGFHLDQKIESLAKVVNKDLNQSMLFDTSFVANTKGVREYFSKLKPVRDFNGKNYVIHTDDGVNINATYFNRGSDTLLVIAEGFANPREYMAPFIAMFENIDVVIFDFRGHGYENRASYNPVKSKFGIDGKLVTLGHSEEKDVHAVVDGFKRLKMYDATSKTYNQAKAYKRVFGLGLCYGAFVLTKAQSTKPGLFDKIVLDGCWHSLDLFVNKIKRDPYTLFSPQTGGWSDHWFFGNEYIQDSLEYLVMTFFLNIKNISLLDYARQIGDTPVLCIHGKDDYMIYKNEFEELWNAFSTKEKTALVTSNPHVRNHWKQKELYKLTCELFFDLPQDELVGYLQDDTALASYYAKKYTNMVTTQY